MIGETRRWTGPDTFVSIRGIVRTEQQLEIKSGALFWFSPDGSVVIDTISSDLVDPRLHTMSVGVGPMTRDDYREATRAKRMADCPANAPVITAEPNAPAHLAPLLRMGVRFF